MRDIIDFHSHVLPGIDDGSKDTNMSLRMLKESAEQGIKLMVATPHFYASKNTPDKFLKNRQAAYDSLKDQLTDELPDIRLGAEVAHFCGMGRADDIGSFAIEDTNLILVEMPFRPWGKSDIKELELLLERDYMPVMAHIERFIQFQKDRKLFDRLLDMHVYIQVNSEALIDWRMRFKVLKFFKGGHVDLLGSDCHNVSTRPQNLKKGRDIIEKKLGAEYLDKIDRLSEWLLAPEEE